MIKRNELRIGNWYNFKNSLNGTLTPTQFSTWTDALDFEAYAEPIPLSAEILEKCGFHVTSKGFWQHPHWYNISLKLHRSTYCPRCNFMDTIANNIDYLHQLQNLCFALTGEELEIKL